LGVDELSKRPYTIFNYAALFSQSEDAIGVAQCLCRKVQVRFCFSGKALLAMEYKRSTGGIFMTKLCFWVAALKNATDLLVVPAIASILTFIKMPRNRAQKTMS
jgi:hypothetical protein